MEYIGFSEIFNWLSLHRVVIWPLLVLTGLTVILMKWREQVRYFMLNVRYGFPWIGRVASAARKLQSLDANYRGVTWYTSERTVCADYYPYYRNLDDRCHPVFFEHCEDYPKLAWMVDARVESNPVMISSLPLPDKEDFGSRPGRFGAHNIHENVPVPTSWHSDRYILGTFFNGGLRAYDIANPYQPKEVAAFVPPPVRDAPTGATQLNDVFVDERQVVYTIDRHAGGLYVLEMGF